MAGLTVGRLAVGLSLRSQAFTKGLQKASKRVSGFASRVRKSMRSLNAFGAAITTVAAGGSIGFLIQRQFEAIDSTQKMADRLGIASDKLVGLRHAAKLTGVEAKTLDISLQRMTRRIAEAAHGTGEAQGALRDLGVDAGELAKLTPDEIFRRLADAMGNVSSPLERVRIGFKLFDSDGVALVETLALGSEGLKEMQAEAERLGLTFDRIESAKIEQANDAFTKMRGALSGVFRQLAIDLAPAVTALADRFTEASTAGNGMASNVSDAVNKIVGPLSVVGTIVRSLEIGFRGIGFVIGAVFEAAVKDLSTFTKAIADIGNDLIGLFNSFAAGARKIGVEIKDLNLEIIADTSAIDAFGKAIEEANAKNKERLDDLIDKAAFGTSAKEEVEKFFTDAAKAADAAAAEIAKKQKERMEVQRAIAEEQARLDREANANANDVIGSSVSAARGFAAAQNVRFASSVNADTFRTRDNEILDRLNRQLDVERRTLGTALEQLRVMRNLERRQENSVELVPLP